MIKKVILIIAAIILIAAFFLSFESGKDYKDLQKKLKVSQIIYNLEKPLPAFSLTDSNNQQFDNSSLKDKWSLLFFGYTNCPDVCPTALMDMASLVSKFKKDNAQIIPEVVFITFDAIRDTPAQLKKYIAFFDKDFKGVSGEQTKIDKLVDFFGAYYERVIYGENNKKTVLKEYEPLPKDAIENGYIINHTAIIYLISPNGQIFASFPAPHNIDKMVTDINLIVENFEK